MFKHTKEIHISKKINQYSCIPTDRRLHLTPRILCHPPAHPSRPFIPHPLIPPLPRLPVPPQASHRQSPPFCAHQRRRQYTNKPRPHAIPHEKAPPKRGQQYYHLRVCHTIKSLTSSAEPNKRNNIFSSPTLCLKIAKAFVI